MTMIPDTTKMGHVARGVMWRRRLMITVSATHRCRHGEAVLHGLALGEHLPPVVRGGGGGGLLHEGGDDLHAVAGPLALLLVAAVGLRHAGTCRYYLLLLLRRFDE